ncbi:MAG: hypothetical protein JWN84_1578 [Nocardioides sp.]|nr:hypothetical protein [Nocardioides sp.]
MPQHPPLGPSLDPLRSADDLVPEEERATAAVLRAVWAALGPDRAGPPRLALRPGPGRWTLEWTATAVLREVADGDAALGRIAGALPGWDQRVRTLAVVRLTALAGGRTVEATHHAGVVVVSVHSRALPVGRARSRALREGRS